MLCGPGAGRLALRQASARAGEQAAVDERAASGGLPSDDPAPASADGQHRATGQHRDDPASQAPARGSPNALKNWRVRSRLFLLVIIPVLAAITLGGIRIASSAHSAFAYQRVVQLANLNGKIIGLEQALQKERQDTITFIALGANGGRAAPRSPSSRLQLTVLSHGQSTGSGLCGRRRLAPGCPPW